MQLAFDPAAWEDYQYWLVTDKAVVRRINKLIADVLRDPRFGIGKPERLIGMELEVWSRRITLEHRLVYVVETNRVVIQSCRYHY